MNNCQNPDFGKLCNMMKEELGHMGNNNAIVVYGLLVEGNGHFWEMLRIIWSYITGCSAELYCMDLLNYKT